MIGSTSGGTDRSENAFGLIPDIEPVGFWFGDLALREKPADVVVRGNVQESCLRAPRLWRPVLGPANARAERGTLSRTRPLGFIDRGTTGLRVDRCENVVVVKRKTAKELQPIAFQYPTEPVP